ncbi:uncharacterized protein LOC125237837 isoform X2 [Leguminivora glycinivorella]|uniref:uncharacterized protein LOC125237837 isoform X2 n=1 Tax=Leguminivora glycinivorella TaxID=1035111 RepID=UPI00200BBAAE|nr:uncharacterized protein LOC125237837 isoform X2 [Leguminivora glycinivorella]
MSLATAMEAEEVCVKTEPGEVCVKMEPGEVCVKMEPGEGFVKTEPGECVRTAAPPAPGNSSRWRTPWDTSVSAATRQLTVEGNHMAANTVTNVL